MIKIIFTD